MSLQHVANHLAQQGRGNDSMLVHMTPSEVAGLRSLAHAKGGDLTINPHTGLPEAGFLDDVIKVAAPIALGAFLGPAGFGLSSMMAGVATGGIMTLATGSLSRGLMAGLGAYGGAGLAEGLAGAGANAIGEGAGAAALEGAGTIGSGAGSTVANVGDEALAAHEAATNAVAKAGPMGTMGAGIQSAYNDPSGFVKQMGGLGNVAKYGLAATAPIMADKGVQTTTAPPVDTGYIRQKVFDPTSQRYITLDPVKAKDWGSRSFSDIYQQPTTAATGGIVALAQGGVAHFDGTDGSAVTADAAPASTGFSNQQISDYVSNIQAQGGGDKEIAAAMDKFGVSTGQLAGALGVNVGDVQSRYNAADTTGNYYTGTSGVSNQDIRNALSGQYAGASDYTLLNAMDKYHITPQQMAYATGVPLAGEGNIMDRYNLAKDITAEGKILGPDPFNPINNINPSTNLFYDRNWVSWMDAHADPITGKVDPVSVKELARVTGMDEKKLQDRYDAAKAAIRPEIIKTDTKTNTGITNLGNPVTTTVLPTNPRTNAPVGTTNPYGNVNNPGDLTFNPDGTVTVQPNIPGRPYGGFSGMNEVKNAYTAGGGSLGYFPQAPKTAADAEKQFNTMTGDSLAAYNFLMGKGAAPLKTTAAQVSRPYSEAVMGIKSVTPTYSASVAKIFDPVTHQIIDNPNYKASPVTGTVNTAGSTLKLPTGGTATFDAGSGYYYLNGKYYDASGNPVSYTAPDNQGAANGGLMGMAAGGMAGYALGGLGSLGGYSDGGRLLRGPGDGVSDSIPASIGNRQPARLADGEFVVPARIVSEIGNGSTEAGARKLYQMMDRVQNARAKTTGKGRVAKDTNASKYLPV
jgi:hypothetical protein